MNDISKVDLNLLKALDALLDERHVTRAALRMGVTQPAMSGMLARMREQFDDPLFVRTQRGMLPTQRALSLAKPLKHVIASISTLLEPEDFDPKTARMTFSIAATDYALRSVVLPFLAELKLRASNIKVSLTSIEPKRLNRQLEDGEVDIALVTPESAPLDLHARHLFIEHYVCALREDHPTLTEGQNILTLDQFCHLDHALVSYTGGGFRGVTDEALLALGRKRNVSLSATSFLILPDILRHSDMVAILPSRLVKNISGLWIGEPPISIPGFTKIAVWHERTHYDAAHRWLRELMAETMNTI